MNNQQIEHQADPKKYFTMIPNLVDDSDLNPFEFRLLVHYYRVGNCWEGTKTTAKKCNMGMGTVSKYRRSLAKKGWIILKEPAPDDYTSTIKITVIDKWAENFEAFTPSPDSTPPSLDESPPSRNESPPSLDETKNNHTKNKQVKKPAEALFSQAYPNFTKNDSDLFLDDLEHYGEPAMIEALNETIKAIHEGKRIYSYKYTVSILERKESSAKQASKGDAVWEEIQQRISNGRWDGLTPTTLAIVRKCGGASVFKSASEQWDIPRLKKQVYSYAQ